jgi:acyl-CoA reductase-like NAD-dependent aldehyde dehydrogenase
MLRYHRSEFKIFRHLIIPALGVATLVPAFFVGCGIPIFKFITPLTYPLNYCAPFVALFWVAGICLIVFHQKRNPATLTAMAHVFEDPSVPAEATA